MVEGEGKGDGEGVGGRVGARLLRVVAVLERVDRAARAELGRGELAERVEVAAALVVLALLIRGVEEPAGEGGAKPMSNEGQAPGLLLGLPGGGGRGSLDGRVAPNTELVAERLAACRAVSITDDNLRGILELISKGVPVRLHLFAVASPRRLELDERGLAGLGDQLVEVLRGQLDGGRAHKGGQKGRGAQHGTRPARQRWRTSERTALP